MCARKQARFVIILVISLTGCAEQHFRAETTWHPDGRVERAIYQQKEFFPEDSAKQWKHVEPAETTTTESFVGKIRDHVTEPKEDVTYIAAWDSFRSAEMLPNSLTFPSADASKAGRLERTVQVNDLGLVTEYVWEERLSDVVSLPDMAAARSEAIEILAELVQSSLSNGELKHDISPLIEWIQRDASAWFDESHETLVEAAIRGELGSKSDESLGKRFAEIAAKYGLELRGEDGALLEGTEQNDAIKKFLVEKTRDLIRTENGAKIDEATARRLLGQIGIQLQRETVEFDPSPDWKRAVQERFGNEEAAKAKVEELATRLFGVYQAGMFTPRRPFHYEMTVPGMVVESSGELTAANRVVWQFDAAEAFPFGYRMSVRSLKPNVAAQKGIFGEVRLKRLEELPEYVRLVEKDANLKAVVQKCVEGGSLQPFDRYERELRSSGDTEPAVLARTAAFRQLVSRENTAK